MSLCLLADFCDAPLLSTETGLELSIRRLLAEGPGMLEAAEILKLYLQGVRNQTGARCVSLFAPGDSPSRALLMHEGQRPGIPELLSLESAQSFELEQAAAPPERTWIRSSNADAFLFRLGQDARLEAGIHPESHGSGDAPRRRQSDTGMGRPAVAPIAAWVGIQFGPSDSAAREAFEAFAFEADSNGMWSWLLAFGGSIAAHALHVRAVLNDPVSGLPGRAQLQHRLSEELFRSKQNATPVSMLLLNPDGFAAINRRLGSAAGDSVIHELAEQLRISLRGSDLVAAYGGVMFGAVLPDTGASAALVVAGKLLASLGSNSYLVGTVKLELSCGIACFDPVNKPEAVPEVLELIWRADQALSLAKQLGGGRSVVWEPGSAVEIGSGMDRLSGIFTGDMARDYRHMALLWETVSSIAASSEIRDVTAQVLSTLQAAFRLERVALFRGEQEGPLELLHMFEPPQSANPPERRVDAIQDSNLAAMTALVEQAWREEQVLGSRASGVPSAIVDVGRTALAVPLIARGRPIGCLYLEGWDSPGKPDAVDVLFLKALAGQLALALDRARLAEQARRRSEQDRERLEAELRELREELGQAQLVHTSTRMDEVLATVRRVAPTDATVLVSGESGTGKELLARTIHRLSLRRDRPLVVVDCASIAESLAESELFGHERGAFTGASYRSEGRLAEADGGTVLLDEVGELPVEMQGKLLRFLQEREVTSVGATRARQLDVRVLAASNRDLAVEVEHGRFRRDLYFRLHVVPILLPPLRDRQEDILPIAQHFLERFARHHHKEIRGFSPSAERHLLAYSWPGNVRELQNRILRAVILCEGDHIDMPELALERLTVLSVPPQTRASTPPESGGYDVRTPAPDQSSVGDGDATPWTVLRERIREQIEMAVAGKKDRAMPLGRWLEEDLVLEAQQASGGRLRRAAALLGVPPTTFRRKLQQATWNGEMGVPWRPRTWDKVRRALVELIREESDSGEDRLTRVRNTLLELTAERFPRDPSLASSILDVTPRTYQRWLEARAS